MSHDPDVPATSCNVYFWSSHFYPISILSYSEGISPHDSNLTTCNFHTDQTCLLFRSRLRAEVAMFTSSDSAQRCLFASAMRSRLSFFSSRGASDNWPHQAILTE